MVVNGSSNEPYFLYLVSLMVFSNLKPPFTSHFSPNLKNKLAYPALADSFNFTL